MRRRLEPILLALLLLPASGLAQRTDEAFLSQPLWNDGQAEIAFYRVERTLDQYGRPNPQSFLVGTYLVKHDYDRIRQAKARSDATDRISSFKWAAFYEFESDNSYQYKRNYVVNASQAELAPLRQTLTSFDWCSNLFRELVFSRDGRSVESLMRSDDYGNAEDTLDAGDGVYPVALVPLLVRSLDFRTAAEHELDVLTEDGLSVRVHARLTGRERVETPAGAFEADRIELDYDGDFRSIFSRKGARRETYWRASEGDRALLRLESDLYTMELDEKLRSPYWRENVYDRLRRVSERP